MKQWTRTAPGQFILWLLILLFGEIAAAAGFASLYMLQMDYYSLSEEQLSQQAISRRASSDLYELSGEILVRGSLQYPDYTETQLASRGIEFFRIEETGQNHQTLYECGDANALKNTDLCFFRKLDWGAVSADTLASDLDSDYTDAESYTESFPVQYTGPYTATAVYESEDSFAVELLCVQVLWQLRYYAPPLAGLCALLAVIFTAVMLHAAGRRRGTEQAYPGFFTRVPYDIFTLLAFAFGLVALLPLEFAAEAATLPRSIAALGIAVLYALTVLLLWLRETAIRHRLGGVWRGSVAAWLWHFCRRCLHGAAQLPLIPLTTALAVVITLGELLGLLLFADWNAGVLLFLWCLEKLILLPCVLYAALSCQKLRTHAHQLAQGELDKTLDTSHMVGALKAHAQDLNAIAGSIDAAVSQRTRSERFKAELITNVSHDIKTPLTSIINYTDLICREKCDNLRITEYAQVLHRQGERLKKLLVDLVEASKASTGNLEVHRAPCRVDVLLDQAAGEYEQRLAQSGLTLVLQKPETGLVILADGRHLWRVFDNLMNNICKYALSGTRVYLTLAQAGTKVRVSFRNISRDPLDMPAAQLLERFARGDAARTTEGSGLGLSIAQSLTELQGGKMELSVDGDLFKVVLSFPLSETQPLTPGPAAAEAEE